MAQAVYLFVYLRLFFYIGVAVRDVCLRLVVVVVGNKVMHRVVWEKLAVLLRQLCGKCFVVCDNQSGLLHRFYNIGNGKSFTRAGYAQKCLMPPTVL